VGSERTVEFFFSPGSRYCYLAGSQLRAIEARTRCRFDWRPVLGPEIRRLRGRDPFQGDPVSGQYDWAYRRRDAEQWADLYGIRFREPPSHEFDFLTLSLAAAAGTRLGAPEAVGWALCSAVYGSDTWPLDRGACIEVATRAGLARSDFERALDDPATRELIARNAREAHERGAFGVPTFFHGDAMYWGNDRLVLLEHALARG
jgi:2-hydroxychromene-2-carboxylate isomerase